MLAGCSPANDLPAAESAAAAFHRSLNAGDFAQIYENANAELKTAQTQAALTKLLSAIHRKLGNFKTARVSGWRDNVTTSGHFVVVGYASTYDQGAAQEVFTYKIAGGQAQLVGFNINSVALIEN